MEMAHIFYVNIASLLQIITMKENCYNYLYKLHIGDKMNAIFLLRFTSICYE